MTESTSKAINVICGEICTTRDCSSTDINLLYRNFNGITANVSFGYERFVKTPEEIPERILDLLQIASYVFCADRMASRGSRESVTNSGWARTFNLKIPVRDLSFWDAVSVKKTLNDVLSFMTGDRRYDFTFLKAQEYTAVQLSLFSEAESELVNAKDADVMLFSGGLDSLAGAIERLNENPNRKLCLVSHKSSTTSTSIQNKLTENLRQAYGDRIVKYGFECHNRDMKTKEETQRTRMFLFSAIAFAICDRLNKNELFIYENGVTSINVPIQVDTINARASRTTHPKTIGLLERFYRLFNPKFRIVTPYRANTKAEIVEKFLTYRAKYFIPSSVSCSSTRNKPQGTPHCGTCSQCIDRKFAMYAVGLDEEDDSYETDFILDENNNELRNRLLSMLMFASKIKNSTPFELWGHSPTDFFDIVSYWQGDNPDEKMAEISVLLNRFADSIWAASKSMLRKNYTHEKVINPNSFIKILASQKYFGLPESGITNVRVRDSVFISYAHEDESYVSELKPFLRVLERDYNIAYWYDKKIKSGEKWDEAIRKHMSRAKIALLLVSQDFIASDFIHNEELPELTKAAKEDGAVLLWLPISHCTWEFTSVADFQSAVDTNPSHPLSEMTKAEKDLVYKKLSLEIKQAFA
jgi:7-cyano-7-deazaguanine synthase in queuosine biosynthesis